MGGKKITSAKTTSTYRPVVFSDINNDFKILTRSTIATDDKTKTIKWEDGNTYPMVEFPISSASCPFYNHKRTSVKALSKVAEFEAKYGLAPKKS